MQLIGSLDQLGGAAKHQPFDLVAPACIRPAGGAMGPLGEFGRPGNDEAAEDEYGQGQLVEGRFEGKGAGRRHPEIMCEQRGREGRDHPPRQSTEQRGERDGGIEGEEREARAEFPQKDRANQGRGGDDRDSDADGDKAILRDAQHAGLASRARVRRIVGSKRGPEAHFTFRAAVPAPNRVYGESLGIATLES